MDVRTYERWPRSQAEREEQATGRLRAEYWFRAASLRSVQVLRQQDRWRQMRQNPCVARQLGRNGGTPSEPSEHAGAQRGGIDRHFLDSETLVLISATIWLSRHVPEAAHAVVLLVG